MAKVTTATLNKQADELLNLYVSLYVDKYGKSPTVNRFKQRWAFKDMITDYGVSPCRAIIEYYFSTGRVGHPMEYLLYNYDKLHNIMVEIAQDEVRRAEIRQETEQRVREWEERGNK